MNLTSDREIDISRQSYTSIFLRFLKFGLLAWGRPFAQIAIIRQELIEEEKWISPERFTSDQALPGSEAHEFCVHFGMITGDGIYNDCHDYREQLVNNQSAHAFLDGVTAGVVVLISATALGIFSEAVASMHAWIIFGIALIILFASKSKWTVAAVVLAKGLYGIIFL